MNSDFDKIVRDNEFYMKALIQKEDKQDKVNNEDNPD
jgi:hypothetical protein